MRERAPRISDGQNTLPMPLKQAAGYRSRLVSPNDRTRRACEQAEGVRGCARSRYVVSLCLSHP